MARVNFCAEKIGDPSLPGVRAIINRLKAKGNLSPDQLVDGCLDLLGPMVIRDDTKQELAAQATLKMMLPMVGCIFPTIWIILLGPAVLVIMKARSGG